MLNSRQKRHIADNPAVNPGNEIYSVTSGINQIGRIV